MARRQKKKKKKMKPLHIIQPNAAGIDIGATEIYVAVPNERATESVRCFTTFTEDLTNAAKWMKSCGIETVAMESTGVYWIPVFQILEAYGFDVALVNARHVKNVPGRKTDVQDCQWLQYLHSVGLLRGSYRPPQAVCATFPAKTQRQYGQDSCFSRTAHAKSFDPNESTNSPCYK